MCATACALSVIAVPRGLTHAPRPRVDVARGVDGRDVWYASGAHGDCVVLKGLLDRQRHARPGRRSFRAHDTGARQPETTFVQSVVDDDLANRARVRPE